MSPEVLWTPPDDIGRTSRIGVSILTSCCYVPGCSSNVCSIERLYDFYTPAGALSTTL